MSLVSVLTTRDGVWHRTRVRRWMRRNPLLTIAAVVVPSIVGVIVVDRYEPDSMVTAEVIVSFVMAQTARVLLRRR